MSLLIPLDRPSFQAMRNSLPFQVIEGSVWDLATEEITMPSGSMTVPSGCTRAAKMSDAFPTLRKSAHPTRKSDPSHATSGEDWALGAADTAKPDGSST